jgi:putative Mn2+ efflux pump MntP
MKKIIEIIISLILLISVIFLILLGVLGLIYARYAYINNIPHYLASLILGIVFLCIGVYFIVIVFKNFVRRNRSKNKK